jgi:formyltetrahydrofolate hydrolase
MDVVLEKMNHISIDKVLLNDLLSHYREINFLDININESISNTDRINNMIDEFNINKYSIFDIEYF